MSNEISTCPECGTRCLFCQLQREERGRPRCRRESAQRVDNQLSLDDLATKGEVVKVITSMYGKFGKPKP